MTSVQHECGKLCKNKEGLKIHQSRMKCRELMQAPQCTGQDLLIQELGQVATYRAQSLHLVRASSLNKNSEKMRIMWPQACKTSVWQKFDEDVDMVLEATRGECGECEQCGQ